MSATEQRRIPIDSVAADVPRGDGIGGTWPDSPAVLRQCPAYASRRRETAAEGGQSPSETPLLEAHRLVREARHLSYGAPADTLGRTAALWSTQFGWECSASDVALAMALVKIARLAHSPDHRDSVVDTHGYVDTYWSIRES